MELTQHAIDRATQRAVPWNVVSTIYAYGSPSFHRGALALRLDREALELARDDLPSADASELDRYRGLYIVVADITVLTVARPSRRRRN